MSDGLLKTAGDWALYVAAVGAFLMLLSYLFRSAWWSSKAGRELVAWMTATAGVLALNAITIFTMGDWPGRMVVRLGLYAALAVFNLRWLYVIIRVQNQARRDRDRDQPGGE